MRTFEAHTMTQLHQDLCNALMMGKKDQLDEWNSVDVQIHDVMAVAERMDWEFDLRELWLTGARWTMMVRQYIDPEQLTIWLKNIEEKIGRKHRGIATMRTKTVPPRLFSNGKITRRWGSCMLAISYKAVPTPTITLHSRTSYLGYLGAMDMTVAWMCGRYVAELLGMEMGEFKFVWMIEMAQFHGFKSLAYLFSYRPALGSYVREIELAPKKLVQVQERPGLLLLRKWLQKTLKEDAAGKTYGDEKYNTYLRIRRRFHTEVLGHDYAQQFDGVRYTEKGGPRLYKAYKPLPSVPITGLDFRSIGPKLLDIIPVDEKDLFSDEENDDADEE